MFYCSIVLIVFFISITIVPALYSLDAEPKGLVFLGELDGKKYYGDYDPENLRNWTESAKICENQNLELASIILNDINDLLKRSLYFHFGPEAFWTSARESRESTMLVWDDLKLFVESYNFDGGIQERLPSLPFKYCGALWVWDEQTSALALQLCDVLNGVICQTQTEYE